MNESPDNSSMEEFEAELSRLRPRALSPGLREHIASKVNEPARASFADRVLMTFMGAGGLAASVIVCLAGWRMLEDHAPRVGPPGPAIAQYPRPYAGPSMGEYQQALARSNSATLELFR